MATAEAPQMVAEEHDDNDGKDNVWMDDDFLAFDGSSGGGAEEQGDNDDNDGKPARKRARQAARGVGGNDDESDDVGFPRGGGGIAAEVEAEVLSKRQKQVQRMQEREAELQEVPPWMDQYPDEHPLSMASMMERRCRSQLSRHHRWDQDVSHSNAAAVPPLVQLHNEIVDFLLLVSPQPEERQTRQDLVKRVTQLAHDVFGGTDKCTVEVFGSQATGLYLPTSDVDVVIHLLDDPTAGTSLASETGEETKKEGGADQEDRTKEKVSKEESMEQERREMDEWDIESAVKTGTLLRTSQLMTKPSNNAAAATAGEGGGKATSASDSSGVSPLVRFAAALLEQWGDTASPQQSGEKENHNPETDDTTKNPKGELSYLEVIENTRVPIVKFTHAPTNLSVDVCFNRKEGPQAARLMTTFVQSLPPLRPLTMILKALLASRGLNEPYSGGIGSYMLQLMIVSFLQQRERDLRFRGLHPTQDARGDFANLGSLLLEFLELYGMDFNYATTAISVRYDGYYFPKGKSAQTREYFWQPSRFLQLALEQPLDTTQDVGRGTFRMSVIQRSFEVAFRTLLVYVSDPPMHDIPPVSILRTILPVTSKMRERAASLRALRSATWSSSSSSSRR